MTPALIEFWVIIGAIAALPSLLIGSALCARLGLVRGVGACFVVAGALALGFSIFTGRVENFVLFAPPLLLPALAGCALAALVAKFRRDKRST